MIGAPCFSSHSVFLSLRTGWAGWLSVREPRGGGGLSRRILTFGSGWKSVASALMDCDLSEPAAATTAFGQ